MLDHFYKEISVLIHEYSCILQPQRTTYIYTVSLMGGYLYCVFYNFIIRVSFKRDLVALVNLPHNQFLFNMMALSLLSGNHNHLFSSSGLTSLQGRSNKTQHVTSVQHMINMSKMLRKGILLEIKLQYKFCTSLHSIFQDRAS